MDADNLLNPFYNGSRAIAKQSGNIIRSSHYRNQTGHWFKEQKTKPTYLLTPRAGKMRMVQVLYDTLLRHESPEKTLFLLPMHL